MNARSNSSSRLPATRDGVDEDPSAAAKVLSQLLERSTRVQAPAVTAYVRRLRDKKPDATPAEIIDSLEKHYLAAVMASGAAVGSAAAFPGIGTLAAMSAVAGETVFSGAGEGNDGPTGGSPREGEPDPRAQRRPRARVPALQRATRVAQALDDDELRGHRLRRSAADGRALNARAGALSAAGAAAGGPTPWLRGRYAPTSSISRSAGRGR